MDNINTATNREVLGIVQFALFFVEERSGIKLYHSRRDWLGKQANIKVENNGAKGYVGISLTAHNPLVFVQKS